MKPVLKIAIKIVEKNSRPVYQYPTVEKFLFSPYGKAKLNNIFHAGGTFTISVWYLHLNTYNKDDADNELVCRCWDDYVYAREGFVKEYLR